MEVMPLRLEGWPLFLANWALRLSISLVALRRSALIDQLPSISPANSAINMKAAVFIELITATIRAVVQAFVQQL
jgi:hypothetical protein